MKKALLLTSLALACGGAVADSGVSETGIRYNEVYAGYERLSNSSITMTGYTIAGSVLVDKTIFIDASYADVAKNSTKSNSTAINVGYRMGISQSTDFIAKLGYISNGGSGGVTSDSSYLITGGLRSMVTPDVELSGQVTYSGLDIASLYYGGALGYYLTENITVRGQMRVDNATKSNTTYIVSVGYNF